MRLSFHTTSRAVQAFANATHAWDSRESVLLTLSDEEGLYGIGEATPLPGHSPDFLPEVENTLRSLDASRCDLGHAETLHAVLQELDAIASSAPASARFALQTAALDLWCKRRNTALATELGRCDRGLRSAPRRPLDPTPSLRVAPLLDVHSPHFHAAAQDRLNGGFTTYKFKIGIALDAELAALDWFHHEALRRGVNVRLRLDANQSLPPHGLTMTLGAFAHLPIEYIEEPCPLEALSPSDSLPLPLALDESLQRGRDVLAPWLRPGRLAAIVCKPMVMGDLRNVLDWAVHARTLGCTFVLSHLFDGPVAFHVYRALAVALAPETHHGLACHPGLELWSEWVNPSLPVGLGLELRDTARSTLGLPEVQP